MRSVPHWGAEAALVARPFLDVETRRLGPGTDVFLHALQAGSTIAGAAERATAATSEFSASDGLAVLIGAHLAVSLERALVANPLPGARPGMTKCFVEARV